uniref:Uncharacterized protein n=1 Tax=Schistocephalus solidus TaxID=70667 RepID=A0A0X3P5K7_SCHSO
MTPTFIFGSYSGKHFKMSVREFYTEVVHREGTSGYLLQHGLLVETKGCRKSDWQMMFTNNNIRDQNVSAWLCRIKGCQSFQSVRKGNDFFHYCALNGRLHLNYVEL